MKPYIFDYIGFATVDKRLSSPMLPWIIAQIHRGTSKKKVKICVEGNNVNGYGGDGWREQVFSHPLQLVSRPTMLPGDTVSFLYIVKDTSQPLLYVHLFQTTEPDDVMELFAAMREQPLKSGSAGGPTGRSLSNASSLTTLCPDISPSSSHFFEVLYIGKIKVLHKRVPDTFIDDALDKFQEIEKEKREKEALLLNHNHTQESEGAGEIQLLSSAGSGKSSTGTFGSTETLKSDASNETAPKPRMRKRSGSAGSVLIKRPETLSVAANAMQEHNRTMVFQVGRNDIRLISPDRKQVLLHKHLKDITYSVQGSKRTSHFAFICREMNSESQGFIGYVFKCQSPSVAEDVVSAISQALTSEACKKQHQAVVSCEHCPMVWYHKLCAEVEGLGERGAQGAILRRLELLPEEEQSIVQTKLQGALESSSNPKEQVELLMMILRTHCESKQSRHVHDTLENRHEFLNHYLGGGTIFMKAKRSLTNSFDQLLKRKGSRDDFGPILKEFSLPANATLCKDAMSGNSDSGEMNQEGSLEEKSGPMMNIFLQVGNSPVKSHEDIEEDMNSQPSSWRQAIFNTVVTPSKTIKPAVKDKEFYRALWKKAINQQVLLIRMEKENARLTARQEEANVKRIKLEYDELGVCESNDIWDIIVTRESDYCDPKLLNQALQKGIPKGKRGEVWMYLADKFCSKLPPVDTTKFPNYNVPYDDLLRQLTSHQHAILIDLGRTFPNHVYYSSPLGPGQLALFNLLKAYSLLDPEVGYCQGLSFIAGVLLLHMSEGEAFVGLKHVMFRRGLRARYLPDMAALQVQLYQLSRLLHDHLPKLYAHFDSYEVSPTLYAAPWLLTIFASQFPLGFVTRVFDVIFAESTDVLFKIALALLDHHKEGLLACDSFELIMDYLKSSVPNIDAKMMNKIMTDVLSRDISKELTEYGVEYHVLQEEMASPRPETKKIKQLEAINKSLTSKNRALTEQLQIATSNINRLETSRSTHMAQINKLESEVRSMEVTVSTLGEFISSLAYNKTDIEIPSEILRIITQVNLSERRKNNAKTGGDKLLKNTMRGVPLRVIDDNNHHHPPPLKFALSSPNLTSKVSNLFSHSGQKPQNRLSPLKDSSDAENTQLKKSLSDAQEMCPNKDLLKSKSAERLDVSKFGRILTTQDRKALRLSETDKTETDKGVDTDSKKRLLKTSQSSYELKSATHPLDSDGVTISFEGTTKLKTLGPARPRPLSSEQDVELKIIEHKNTAPDKLKLTIDKVTHLFGSIPDPEFSKNQVEFEKPRGKETELMIQSQAPANKTGVLT